MLPTPQRPLAACRAAAGVVPLALLACAGAAAAPPRAAPPPTPAAAAVAPAPAATPGASAPSGAARIALRVRFRRGDRIRVTQREVVESPLPAMRRREESVTLFETLEVHPDGWALQRLTPQPPAGAPPGPAEAPITIERGPRGEARGERARAEHDAEYRRTAEAIEQFSAMAPLLPDSPVAVGETWSSGGELAMPLGGGRTMPLRIRFESTLIELPDGPDGDRAVVRYVGEMVPAEAAPSLDLHGDIRGEATYDLARGSAAREHRVITTRIRAVRAGQPVALETVSTTDIHSE
jgi:hypothetical protein